MAKKNGFPQSLSILPTGRSDLPPGAAFAADMATHLFSLSTVSPTSRVSQLVDVTKRISRNGIDLAMPEQQTK